MRTLKNDDVDRLLSYIDFFKFDFTSYELVSNDNICAVLAEVVLQSGMNYKTVVYPRVARIKLEFDFLSSIDSILNYVNLVNIEEILLWSGSTRKERFLELVTFLSSYGINSCNDLHSWLLCSKNQNELLKVKGIGPKSLDYLMLLVGISSIPIDRHLLSFAQMSGVQSSEYQYISSLYKKVSDYYDIEYHVLDSTIWNFMNRILVS